MAMCFRGISEPVVQIGSGFEHFKIQPDQNIWIRNSGEESDATQIKT